MLHRKLVCHVYRLRPICAAAQRSPPPTKAPRRSRWDQLPAANRQRLLHLLSRLVERQLPQQAPLLALLALLGAGTAGSEEAMHDLPH